VSIIRKLGEYLGTVEGRDREAAEAAAIKQFQLKEITSTPIRRNPCHQYLCGSPTGRN
jgi:hypothetical protein